MRMETEIINTLNQPNQTTDETVSLLSKIWKRRRGENRELIYCVQQMLDLYYLPIRYDEELKFSREKFITERNYMLLKNILLKSNNVLFNALCAEILWNYRREREYAEIALINYNLLIDDNRNQDFFSQLYISVCRVYSKYHSVDFDYPLFFNKAISFVRSRFQVDDYRNAFVLMALSKCKMFMEDIKNVFVKIIESFEQEKDFSIAIGYTEEMLKISDAISPEEKRDLMIRIAKNYEKQANVYDWTDAENAHSIIRFIQLAMNWWEKSKSPSSKEERKKLAKAIEPVKKLSLKTMQTISLGEINISEWMENRKAFIDNNNIATVVLGLAEMITLVNEKSAHSNFAKSGFVATQFFSTNILDSDGRTKCIIPPLSENKKERLAFLEYETKKTYDFYSGFVLRYLAMAKEKFDFNEKNLEFLFENNIIVQPDRINSFKQGILSGFEGKYSNAMYLLMPQVEHSLRCLAEDCGAVVYRTNTQGVEESLSLESILNCSEICDSLDDTLLFNLRLFYTSPYGYGMRNEVSHGLLSDDELNSGLGLMVWWFTLKLCCMFAQPYLNYYRKKMISKKDD